jgi:sugar lactone lactonase YvrE
VERFIGFRKFILILISFLLLLPSTALAKSPYEGYIYDSLNYTPHSINGYLYKDSIDGYELPTGPFKEPEDIFVAPDDTLYIVDSGNNRVIHMDGSKNLLGVFGDEKGSGKLKGPKGVFVTNEGTVYVADTMNRRIAVFGADGGFLKEFKAPQSPLLNKDFVYSPSKVIVDKRNYMFVVSDGTYQGLLQIDPNGEFKGFFGANPVGFSWSRVFIKLLASKEQKEQINNEKPPNFSNLFQDHEGFIYTTTFGIPYNQVKRLSAVGVDTLNTSGRQTYGDIYLPRENWRRVNQSFVDATVNDKGIITALDMRLGRVYQYDKLGNLLFIFGGLGEQNGLFKTPASIAETADGMLYVADRNRHRIDRFRTTPFADTVHKASSLYVEGFYDEAMEPWNEVLKMNSNYDLAYRAIGKSLYRSGKYEEAMTYFKAARARAEYAQAFLEHRKEWMREHFGLLVGGIVMLFILYKYAVKYYRRRRESDEYVANG